MSGVFGAVKFNPVGYSQYIDAAKSLYLSNIDAQRLLGWLDGNAALHKMLADKVKGLESWD
ncbi:hypothetical protein C3M30_09000 [Salmonella enterica]|nr:hypothetical protein [Salmonella enterica]